MVVTTYYLLTTYYFRFVMIKYTNRGLVNDRYYWNMNWSLLRTLFWTGNIVMLVSDQANYLATYLEHGHSIFAYTYRFDCQTSSFVIGLREEVKKSSSANYI